MATVEIASRDEYLIVDSDDFVKLNRASNIDRGGVVSLIKNWLWRRLEIPGTLGSERIEEITANVELITLESSIFFL